LERFVTAADAARILGVTRETVRSWIRRGLLHPDGLLERGTYLIRRDTVERLAEQRMNSGKGGDTYCDREDTEDDNE
jgi:excisionase family DNA binding protein